MSAQNPQIPANATPDEIKKIKEEATLRKEALEALAGEAVARKALAAAQDTAKPPLADQLAAAKAAKELADAQKAQADAEKARTDAALAAAKAKFGEIPSSGYGGTAEMGTNAGNAEAMLLGAKAVQEIARTFAESLCRATPDRTQPVLLFTAGTVPSFQALLSFNAQREAFKTEKGKAEQATKDAEQRLALSVSVATVGLALDALNKVLGYFKSDYEFQGIEVASSDAMLVAAAAEQLRVKGMTVQMPTVYQPAVPAQATEVLERMAEPFEWVQTARERQRRHEGGQADLEARIAELQKLIADSGTEPARKSQAEEEVRSLQPRALNARDAAVQWKALAERLEAWTRQLTTADDKGNLPLTAAAQQAALRGVLDAGATIAVLQLHKLAGTGYTKKNLWSSLGANPFYVMGGAVASMTAFDGKTGTVITSAHLPWHGGYHSVSDLMVHVNGSALARGNRPVDSVGN